LAAAIVAEPKNLRGRVMVRADAPAGTGGSAVAPGERAVIEDRAADLSAESTARLYYVTVPIVGGGRGRRGPLSAPVPVPLGPRPPAPSTLTFSHDETTLTMAWVAQASAGRTFRVTRTNAAGVDVAGSPAVPVAASGASATLPVEFGREICVVVRTIESTGAVTLEGDPSPPSCVTPVDRYAPAAPTGLQIVQDGAAVTLVWNAVDASDVAGYVVLRGVGAATTLQPLVRTPIRETTYRDTTVAVGSTYVYAVYATDNAATPNVSQLSARQTVTVR
jgi:hypothetical protein